MTQRQHNLVLISWIATIGLSLVVGACAGGVAGPGPAPFESDAAGARILVSESPDRRLQRALNGATVAGVMYVTFDPAGAEELDRVSFVIVDTPLSESVEFAERLAPYDLGGGDEAAANGFDTRTLPDGLHRLTVVLATDSGEEVHYRAWFDVRNGAAQVVPGDIYVAPGGSDQNPGSVDRPLRSLQAAIDSARAGDVIYLRGGNYRPTAPIEVARSGNDQQPIRLLAYPGERPVVDGSGITTESPVMRIRASYWVIKGIEIRNGPWFGIFIEHAAYNHFEGVATHHNGHSGIHLEDEASFNTFVRVDSYANYDPGSGGQNADGFAIKRRSARHNVLLLCRAWNNSDDGFDLLESAPQRIDRSEAFRNGYREDGTPFPNGNGNGFKLGIGEGQWETGGGHLITRSVAWGNETWGFNSNNGTIPIHAYNNTAWDNGARNYLFNKAAHVLINNVSFGARVAVEPDVIEKRNSWQLGIDDPEFLSLDPESPEFLHLSPTSPALAAGIDVGLEFTGHSPDLGAFDSRW